MKWEIVGVILVLPSILMTLGWGIYFARVVIRDFTEDGDPLGLIILLSIISLILLLVGTSILSTQVQIPNLNLVR